MHSARRSRPWFDVRVPATYRTRASRGLGTASRLSAMGAVIERATEQAPLGSRVRLELALPGGELEVTGEVVRRTPDGFAVRFALLCPADERSLEDLLAKAEAQESEV